MFDSGGFIDLNCDNRGSELYKHVDFNGVPHVYNLRDYERVATSFKARNKTSAIEHARQEGWLISSDEVCVCPVCNNCGVRLRDVRKRMISRYDRLQSRYEIGALIYFRLTNESETPVSAPTPAAAGGE